MYFSFISRKKLLKRGSCTAVSFASGWACAPCVLIANWRPSSGRMVALCTSMSAVWWEGAGAGRRPHALLAGLCPVSPVCPPRNEGNPISGTNELQPWLSMSLAGSGGHANTG